MTESDEIYREFKKFLADYLIRKAKDEWKADDFAEEKSEDIRLHMENLLPSLSLTEVMRIRVYFNDMFIYYLTGALGKPSLLSSQMDLSLDESDDVQSFQLKRLKTQSATEELSTIDKNTNHLSTQTNAQEQTPVEELDPVQRRTIAPIMQSTPLSVPIPMEGETGRLSYQNRLETAEGDEFIADIISQINLSPILQASEPRPAQPQQSTRSLPDEIVEVPFLNCFTNLSKKSKKPRQTQDSSTRRSIRERLPIVESVLRQAKRKKKKIDFEVLYCLPQKQKTEKQIKTAEETILYFQLMPGKTRNMLKRVMNNVVIPEGERGHIPMERIINLSNVMRAHASQRQLSVEQPRQTSQLSTLHSPSTPQGLLRASQLLPFMPIRGDISSPLPGIELEQVLSFPRRSILRQQPLLTIPERDTLIPILLSPHPEEPSFDNLSVSIPQCPPENLSTIPLEIGGDIASLSNLPTIISEEIEMNDQHPQTSHGVVPMEIDEIPSQVEEIPQMIVPQINSNEVIPELIVPPVGSNEDNRDFSWFEVLRPRADIVYPQVDGERRRKKKRKRKRDEAGDVDVPPLRIHELPEIPMSPDRSNFQNIPVLLNDFSDQITQVPLASYLGEMESEFEGYFNLIKEAGKNPDYRTWERFDPYLFSESDNFEMYTYIFKRLIKEDFVAMDTLYQAGTTRLEAAKGFKFILELKTMGLIDIDANDTRIVGFKFKAADL